MSQTIPSWSISRVQTFEKCKYWAKLQWLDKIPDTQPKTAADRGSAIHLEAENFVRGEGQLTPNLRFFEADLNALAHRYSQGKVICEEEWGFDKNWQVAEWKKAWLRLKCDAVYHIDRTNLAVIDYKTGKRFGNEVKHAIQLQLYALCALIRYPEIEHVTCELWYLDHNELASFNMKRTQLKKYLSYFDKKGREFTEETVFKPNPNIVSCKYCPYHPNKQGDCKFGVITTAEGNVVRAVKEMKVPEKLTAAQEAKKAALLGRLG